MKSFSALMAIITCRCPKLEDLEVDFRDEKKTFKKIDDELYTIPPGSLLPRLTSLTLKLHESSTTTKHDYGGLQYVREPRDSLLSIVGKLCPVLTTLKFGRVSPSKKHVVALICNAEMANILFPVDEHRPWMPQHIFSGLRIPCEFLNPLCSTLKELTILEQHNDLPTLCFALRHFPKLENLDVFYLDTIKMINLFYSLRDVDQKPFEEAWSLGLDVASSSFTFFPGK